MKYKDPAHMQSVQDQSQQGTTVVLSCDVSGISITVTKICCNHNKFIIYLHTFILAHKVFNIYLVCLLVIIGFLIK